MPGISRHNALAQPVKRIICGSREICMNETVAVRYPVSATYAKRYANGKALRKSVARESLGDYRLQGRDPLVILNETNKGRLSSLLPVRRKRMSQSAFAFLRGAAAIMAQDVASLPMPGIKTQACGDSHLLNFGAFQSPEGNILFDINDFDETLPDVDFTVDVRRLATSFAVAAIDGGYSDRAARRIARIAAGAYRQRMVQLSRCSPLKIWQSRILLAHEASGLFVGNLSKKLRRSVKKPSEDETDRQIFPQLHQQDDGEWRITDNPPYIFHVDQSSDPAAHVDIAGIFESLRATLSAEVGALLRRYQLRDTAFKVVGVGSVGAYCAIGLFMTEDDEPLILQIKEAGRSALERLGVPAWTRPQGERVVSGQRIMQGATDLFLGSTTDVASARQFYVRQLKNRRLGSVAELLEDKALPQYATLCGRTLARAHARSADAAVLAGYMGRSDVFEDALASFAMLYSGQNTADYEYFRQNAQWG
jgi:uncharacterized protein (DUF2252 family)